MDFFQGDRIAARYERHRPKVHGVLVEWLQRHLGASVRFRCALDVGCGTGDSMVPLRAVADRVEGVDISAAMLALARAKGLDVRLGTLDEVPAGRYDLVTACMALHWLAPAAALAAFQRASAPGAVWLVANFGLAGQPGNPALAEWLGGPYRQQLPYPHQAALELPADPRVTVLARERGAVPVRLDAEGLVGYLLTRSNVEWAVRQGQPEAEVERWLRRHLPPLGEGPLDYGYRYTVLRTG